MVLRVCRLFAKFPVCGYPLQCCSDQVHRRLVDVQLALEGHAVGAAASLDVLRGGESRALNVVVGERPRSSTCEASERLGSA